MQNQWISTVEALRENVAQKERFIEKLLAENLELLDACRGLLDMITDNRLHGAEVYRASDAIKNAEVKP